MPDKPQKSAAMQAGGSGSAAVPAQAGGAFFGRRKGRPLRPQRQSRLFSALLPQLQINLACPAPQDLTQLFGESAGAIENVRLEIGFGGGEHLLHEAARFPATGFIGAEPFTNGLAKMLAALAAKPSRAANLRLYPDDALPLLNWLPEAALAGIDIFYPDPWPKKKHQKRRFVNAENLSRFARALKPGGILRFASDIDAYVNQVLQLMRGRADFVWQAETKKDWQTPYQNWPSTRYEEKAKRAGRSSAYLSFIRS